MFVFILQAGLKHIRRSVFGWEGCQGSSVDLEQPPSHPPAPRLPVSKHSCWGPSPREGPSLSLLPGKRPTGKVQCGQLLHSGEALLIWLHVHVAWASIVSSSAVPQAKISLIMHFWTSVPLTLAWRLHSVKLPVIVSQQQGWPSFFPWRAKTKS